MNKAYLTLFITSLLLIGCSSPSPTQSPIKSPEPVMSTVVFAPGESGYEAFSDPQISIPSYRAGSALVDNFRARGAVNDSFTTIYAFAVGHIESSRERVFRSSTDGGQSWSEINPISAEQMQELLGAEYKPMQRGHKSYHYLKNGLDQRWRLQLTLEHRSLLVQASEDDGQSWTQIYSVEGLGVRGCDMATFFDGSTAIVMDEPTGSITMDVISSTEVITAFIPEPTLTVYLYPDGQRIDHGTTEHGHPISLGPGEDNGLRGAEVVKPNGNISNVGDSARLEVFLPEEPSRGQMVIICPGGGYANLAVRREGYEVAKWLNDRGIAAGVLIYRMPNGHKSVPLIDVQNAFRYCRAHADEWEVSQVGIMGFSAGGHLCTYASTCYVDEITRPDFQIPIYAAVDLSSRSGRAKLVGEDNEQAAIECSTQYLVSPDTPPALIAACADDMTVPVDNSLLYYEALRHHGVKSELLILPYGGHGWGWGQMESATYDKLEGYREVLSRAVLCFLEDMQKNH